MPTGVRRSARLGCLRRVAVIGTGPPEVARRLLSAGEVTAISRREVEASRAAAAELRAHGFVDGAEDLDAEATIAASYLKDASP